jgi:hypothetical protein
MTEAEKRRIYQALLKAYKRRIYQALLKAYKIPHIILCRLKVRAQPE